MTVLYWIRFFKTKRNLSAPYPRLQMNRDPFVRLPTHIIFFYLNYIHVNCDKFPNGYYVKKEKEWKKGPRFDVCLCVCLRPTQQQLWKQSCLTHARSNKLSHTPTNMPNNLSHAISQLTITILNAIKRTQTDVSTERDFNITNLWPRRSLSSRSSKQSDNTAWLFREMARSNCSS